MQYYLKKCKLNKLHYSEDHMIFLSDNFDKNIEKYLKRTNLGINFLIKSDNYIPNCLNGIYLSKYGNFLYVIQDSINLNEQIESLIPMLENSYDIIKQYIILNEWLSSKYEKYNAYSFKNRDLKKQYIEINSFLKFYENLKNDSMGSVGIIINKFEKNCPNINFTKRAKAIEKYIRKELKTRKKGILAFLADFLSKIIGEIYDKTINRFNNIFF